ncbi:MAG: hypothetical protein ACRDS0_29355 [Pseudonocardiaceae bacterium]
MPDCRVGLVDQQVSTILGTLEIALPAGAVLEPDPGAVEGLGWWWSPRPDVGVFTFSQGEADQRTPAYLLALERSLEDNSVVVLHDEAGNAEGERRLEFLSSRVVPSTFGVDASGHHCSDPGGVVTQRARFRFWQRDELALRVGYRLDEAAAPEWRATFDGILDSARLQ